MRNNDLETVYGWPRKEIMLVYTNEDVPRQIPLGTYLYVSEPQYFQRSV